MADVIAGQTTSVFARNPNPATAHRSFSLTYTKGSRLRSLDVVCADEGQYRLWFTSLKQLTQAYALSTALHRGGGAAVGAGFSESESESEVDVGGGRRSRASSSDDSSVRDSSSTDSLDALDSEHPARRVGRPAAAAAAHRRAHLDAEVTSAANGSSSSTAERAAPSARHRRTPGSSMSMSMSPLETLCDVYAWGNADLVASQPGEASEDRALYCVPRPLPDCWALDGLSGVSVGARHAAIAVGGELFTWGEASGGRLGTRTGESSPVPQRVALNTGGGEHGGGVRAPDAGVRAMAVGCGSFFTAAVTEAGELYTWGSGLGTGVLSQVPCDSNVARSHLDDQLRAVAHAGAYAGEGEVTAVPARVRSPHLEGERVRAVACGAFTMAVTTESGALLTCGEGTFGALGQGDQRSHRGAANGLPASVGILAPVCGPLSLVSVAHVRCGAWHSAAITIGGEIFTWGSNDKGQLALGKKGGIVSTPARVDLSFLAGSGGAHVPAKLACGAQYTMVLTRAGELLTCGGRATLAREAGEDKKPDPAQLGQAFPASVLAPATVGKGMPATQLSGGAWHAAVVVAGKLYTWGRGKGGRLGHGNERDESTPRLVEALAGDVGPVLRASCGEDATVAVVANAAAAKFKVSGVKAKGASFAATVRAIKAIAAMQPEDADMDADVAEMSVSMGAASLEAHAAGSADGGDQALPSPTGRRRRASFPTGDGRNRGASAGSTESTPRGRRPRPRRMSSAEVQASALALMSGQTVPQVMEARMSRERSLRHERGDRRGGQSGVARFASGAAYCGMDRGAYLRALEAAGSTSSRSRAWKEAVARTMDRAMLERVLPSTSTRPDGAATSPDAPAAAVTMPIAEAVAPSEAAVAPAPVAAEPTPAAGATAGEKPSGAPSSNGNVSVSGTSEALVAEIVSLRTQLAREAKRADVAARRAAQMATQLVNWRRRAAASVGSEGKDAIAGGSGAKDAGTATTAGIGRGEATRPATSNSLEGNSDGSGASPTRLPASSATSGGASSSAAESSQLTASGFTGTSGALAVAGVRAVTGIGRSPLSKLAGDSHQGDAFGSPASVGNSPARGIGTHGRTYSNGNMHRRWGSGNGLASPVAGANGTATGRGTRTRRVEAAPGVQVTLVRADLPGARTELQSVRFSRRHFADEAQAERWWSTNKAGVLGRLCRD